MTLYGGGYEQGENSASGSLTVTARVSNGASRHAMPSLPELVYAALLYPANNANQDFVQAETADGGKLNFSFQRPKETSGLILEIFAFVKTEGDETPQFSRKSALLSGKKAELAIDDDEIVVTDPIALSSDKPGTVSLKIKVPDACTLEIDDAHFAVAGDSPEFTLTQAGDGISADAYPLTFTVKKGDEIVQMFSEYINVINGLCTDTWGGLEKGAAKDVTNGMSKTVYVRGTGGWYDGSDYKGTATADDGNTGSFLAPLATIQRAVEKIIAMNDGTSEYTIYVDGTLTQSAAASANGMADFSALKKNLTLTIKALSGTATLDGGARFDENGNVTAGGIGKRVIYAKPESGILTLTLDNLVITGGNTTENGGGVCFSSSKGTLTISDGTAISRNKAADGGGVYDDYGKFTMTAGTISGNTATNEGGGICLKASNTLKISGSATISENKAKYGGGIAKDVNGFIEMDGGEISRNIATSNGGGIYSNSGGSLTISGGTIKENEATQSGGGIYHWSASSVTISGGATIRGNKAKNGGGMYVGSSLYVEGGAISGNTATNDGGGIYFNSSSAHTFEISGGTIGGASDSDKNTAKNGGGVYAIAWKPTMSGGTISGNTASENGGGVYVTLTSTFTMSGSATISGNTASSGGGIYNSKGTFIMKDGTISGNSASKGNGAYLAATGKLNMSDAAQFAESDDVYLSASGTNIPTICVAGALTAASPVAKITPSAYTAGRQVLSADTGVEITPDVCRQFALTADPDSGEWEIIPDDNGAAGVLGIDAVYLNSSSGSDTNSGLTASKAVKTLSKAIELFDSKYAQKIMVCYQYDLPIEESDLLNREGKRHLTLMRYDGSSDVSHALTDTLLRINQGDVTITNVTLDGNKENVGKTQFGRLLYISNSDTVVTLGDGATVRNNWLIQDGGGVFVYGGTFKMKGGKITGNETSYDGGGVCLSGSSARFEMSGGEISGNTAGADSYHFGGGVYVDNNGTFTMEGGTISGNTATTNGAGVYVKTGGTFTQTGGTFTQTGGTVSGNSPDDVYPAP